MSRPGSPPCPRCGSTKSDQLRGRCRSDAGCDARRVARRISEDAKRGGPQCMASRGSTSIRFCLMREGHAGRHANGSVEWGDAERTVAGEAFAGALKAMTGEHR